MSNKSLHSMPLASFPTGGCEWDPDADRLSRGDNAHYATRAVWLLKRGMWLEVRVCDECSKLDKFKQYKKRIKV